VCVRGAGTKGGEALALRLRARQWLGVAAIGVGALLYCTPLRASAPAMLLVGDAHTPPTGSVAQPVLMNLDARLQKLAVELLRIGVESRMPSVVS
jgi:hypothetical protein